MLIEKSHSKHQRAWNAYFNFLFALSLAVHLASALTGWHNTLLDYYGFRQAQTAITTFYTLREGVRLDYITPVLGAPWSIPMEFPLYQWIVAAFVWICGTPIAETGRFVSLVSFYLSLLPLYLLLGLWIPDKTKRLIPVSMLLLTPSYIFWSRTFLIESFVLLLSASFLWALASTLQHRSKGFLALTIALGALAGITKATTFIAFLAPAVLLMIWYWSREGSQRTGRRLLLRYAVIGFLSVVVPFAVTALWTWYADEVKMQNPLAAHFLVSTSAIMSKFNFGTWQQRFDINVWSQIIGIQFLPNELFGSTQLFGFRVPHIWFLLTAFMNSLPLFKREPHLMM